MMHDRVSGGRPARSELILQRYLTAEIAETAEKGEAWVTTNSSQ